MKTNLNTIVLLMAGAFCASWAHAALAEPITYTFTAEGPITGTLGGVAICSDLRIATLQSLAVVARDSVSRERLNALARQAIAA